MPIPDSSTQVVTAFIAYQDKLLVLQRSDEVRTYRGQWGAVSGYLETPSPLTQALTEIVEETGLTGDDIKLVCAGEPLEISDEVLAIRWRIHPFLFTTNHPEKVRLSREHVALQWVQPNELGKLNTVPALAEALARVWKE